MKKKHWINFIPLFMVCAIFSSAFLFPGCAARTYQDKGLPEISGKDQDVPRPPREGVDRVPAEAGGLEADISGLLMSEQTCAAAGDEVTFTVLMHNAPNAVSALGFDIVFDQNILEYRGFARGDLTQGFDMFDVGQKEGDTLRVGGVIAQGEIARGSSGAVAEFTFAVRECESTTLKLDHLTDDVGGWTVQSGQLSTEEGSDETEEGENIQTPEALEQEPAGAETVGEEAWDDQTFESADSSEERDNLSSPAGDENTAVDSDRTEAEVDQSEQTGASPGGDAGAPAVHSEGNAATAQTSHASFFTVQSPEKVDKAGDKAVQNTMAVFLPQQVQGNAPAEVSGGGFSNEPVNAQPVDTPPAQDRGGIISIDDQPCQGPGQDVIFSVSVNNVLNKADALGFEIGFDESILTYKGFSRGDLTQAYDLFYVNQAGAGRLRVAGINSSGTGIVPAANGTILTLAFSVNNCPSTTSTLHLGSLADDLAGWSLHNGHLYLLR
ncbi:MAG: cohesin domain-containing protein [bacterium]